MTAIQSPSIPSPRLPPLEDEEFLFNTLAEITQESQETVRKRYAKECNDLGCNVREEFLARGFAPHEWCDELNEFYASTNAFLYETLVWNRRALKNEMRGWVGEYLARQSHGPSRVLTFGDGLGIESLYLGMAGHQVDYFEVSAKCLRFSQALAARLSTELRIIDDPKEIPLGHYDAIVCLDVLEHIPEPQSIVQSLAAWLRPGGKLIVHAPFWYLAPAVETHLRANRRFSGDWRTLYKPCGFHPVDGQLFWNPIVFEKTGGELPTCATLAKRLHLEFGGVLLGIGRFFNWPHIQMTRLLSR